MIKKTLVIFATMFLVSFGLLLFISQKQKTSIADLLAFQISRVLTRFKFKEESDYAKFILTTIITSEKPVENWKELVGPRSNRFGEEMFYFFKVWFVETGTTIKDIEKSYTFFGFEDNGITRFELWYGVLRPTIQFKITKTKNGRFQADFMFPLNNCLFEPDYNNDDIIDIKDVILARESRSNEIKG